MVTPELISYIKGEFAKGKTREMIRVALVSEGGWNDSDLNDAFRTAIPMQSFATNPSPIQSNPIVSSITKNSPLQNNVVKNSFTQSNLMKDSAIHNSFQSSSAQKSSAPKLYKILLIVFLIVIVGGAGALWYFRPLLVTNTLDSLSKLSSDLFSSFLTTTEDIDVTLPVVDDTIVPVIPAVAVKDCGTSISPDFKNSATYKDNAVLNCLGNSALFCEAAKAVLTNSLFPEVMEIVKDPNMNTCNFRLTYKDDSTLEDPNGNSLRRQSISCPLSIVKAIDETKINALVFTTPTLADINKYASQIYFYGTLGVFMENNVDINKIQAAGCTGTYIDSVVLSFQETR